MSSWIICTGPDWFRPSVTSTRQIILHFHKDGYKILWVNPIAFKSPSVNSVNRNSLIKKILDKLQTHLKFFKRVDKSFYILIPFYVPIFNSFWDDVNTKLIRIQVIIVSRLLNITWNDTILWISGSFTLSPLLKYNFKVKVYQASDLISDYRTNDTGLLKILREKESFLTRNVNFIFASSPNIKNKLEKLSDRTVHLLTHGVDFMHFTKQQSLNRIINVIRSKGLPIVGYYGTLSDANDKQVFSILAENGFSVVLIGKELGDYSSLKNKDNVYFTGPIDYKILPSFAQGFDICLLNWVMADWIKNSYPLKALEYLAMGKPVISCKIPVIEQLFGDLVYFADTPEDFLLYAKKSLVENNESIRNTRIEAVSKYTWERKFKYIKSIIK